MKWIAGCAEIGYGTSVREIRAVVGAIVSSKLGLDSPIVVNHGWWDRFRQCHLHLVLRTSEGIAFKRLAATNKNTINHYYNLLKETMKDNRLLNAPHLIFNCNETGMPLCSRPGKRVGIKGSKHVQICNSGLKTNITVLHQCWMVCDASFHYLSEKKSCGVAYSKRNTWDNVWHEFKQWVDG